MLSAERALAQQLGRAPDRDELGGRMQTATCDVERLQQCRHSEISLDGDSETGEMWVRPLVDTDAASPEEELLRDETFQIVHQALGMLTTRERTVVVERYGLSDGRIRTLREVAVELRLSRERVRQIESTARLKIARHIACRPSRPRSTP
jgi:RNA polymerase nonessential primary-like sigma factor